MTIKEEALNNLKDKSLLEYKNAKNSTDQKKPPAGCGGRGMEGREKRGQPCLFWSLSCLILYISSSAAAIISLAVMPLR